MKLKNYKIELFLLLFTALTLFVMFFINDINIHVRLNELQQHLQKTNQTENYLDNLNLVAKYKLQMQMYNKEISQEKVDYVEVKVNALLKNIFNKKAFKIDKYEKLASPVVFIINMYRSILKMKPIEFKSIDTSNKYLEVAYYYERHNLLKKALEFYKKSLEEDSLNSKQKYSLLLHRGYCHSILGNYTLAKQNYTRVIKESGIQDLEVNSALLLKYLETFKQEVTKILNNEKDSVMKGEKLFNLIAYSDSINVLKKVEKEASPKMKLRINYIKAKSFEAFGENESAVKLYQDIIIKDSKSKYAKMSNRRIFVIGSNAHNGKKIKDLAIKNNKIIRDKNFSELYNLSQNLEKLNKADKDINKTDIFKNMLVNIEKSHPILKEKDLSVYEKTITEIEEQESNERKIQKYKIFTVDGSIYIGKIAREDDTFIYVETIIGVAKVKKNEILKRKKI